MQYQTGSSIPGAPGNFAGIQLAQAMPQAMGLGGPMQMNQGYQQFQQPQFPGAPPPNVFSLRPSIHITDENIPTFGGSVNIPIGQQGRIYLNGTYDPANEGLLKFQGTIGQPPGSEKGGIGIDITGTRKMNPNPSMMMGPPNDFSVFGRGSARF
jgi:hypothetical protein